MTDSYYLSGLRNFFAPRQQEPEPNPIYAMFTSRITELEAERDAAVARAEEAERALAEKRDAADRLGLAYIRLRQERDQLKTQTTQDTQ